jgi:hypothetical protein
MEFENESLEADNRRYSAEVTDLAGENSALLAENSELRAQGDELLGEVRNMRRALLVGRTDLLYLKLKLKGFEMRLNECGDDGHLQEDIEEWKRNWRLAKGMRDEDLDGVVGVQAGSDDTRSTISLGDGGQLVITRAAAAMHMGRSAALAVNEMRAESVDADEDEEDDDYEQEADDEGGDESSPEGDVSDDGTADDEATDNGTVMLEPETTPSPPTEMVKTPWEKLWDDLAAFAGVHDYDATTD